MRRRLIWLALALGIVLFFGERQISYLTFVGTAGATGVLERGDVSAPVVLFSGMPIPEGGAELRTSGEALLGAYALFRLPDGAEVRCTLRLGRIRCTDGWRLRLTDGRIAE